MGIKSFFGWIASAFISLFSTTNAKNKPLQKGEYSRDPVYDPFTTGKKRRKQLSPVATKKRKQKNAAQRRARKQMYAAR